MVWPGGPGPGLPAVDRRVVPGCLDGTDGQARGIGVQRGQADRAETGAGVVLGPHGYRDRVGTAGVDDAGRDREQVLRSDVVDVAADLPAVHEQQRAVVPAGTIRNGQRERGVLVRRQLQGLGAAVPRAAGGTGAVWLGRGGPPGVRESGQEPAVALAAQTADVERAADRVDRVVGAEVALDAPVDARARPGQRDRGEAARLFLGVVGLEVLVVPGVVDEDGQHVVAAGLRDA